MGFFMHGHPDFKAQLSERFSKRGIKMLLSVWANNLNYKNYKSVVFPHDVKQYGFKNGTLDEDLSKLNGDSVLKRRFDKNKFIEWELKSVSGYLRWIEKIFEFHRMRKENIPVFKRDYQVLEIENMNFLKDIKKNRFSTMKLDLVIQEKVDTLNEEDLIYFYIILYQDLTKTERFLEDHYDYTLSSAKIQDKSISDCLPEPTNNSESKVFKTVWEAVLYHSVLVSVDGSKYSRSKKDIPELVHNWLKPNGEKISHHTFYHKLLEIEKAKKGISHPQHGKYTEKDYFAVEERLSKEKPEAIYKLKGEYFYNELY